jgi:hypothetical protein
MLTNQCDELRRVACLPDHLKAGTLKQVRQAFAEQDVIIRKRHPGRARRHEDNYRRPAPAGRALRSMPNGNRAAQTRPA